MANQSGKWQTEEWQMSDNVANGELKSKMVANDTVGGKGVVAIAHTELVAGLKNSAPNGRKSTTAIDLARLEQSLQIMRDCVDMVHGDGVATEIATFTSESGKLCVLVVLQDVKFEDDDFVYVGKVASGK